ncbi:hypothetical protein [Marinoscillum sp.]|uniref:hypothetical protein n=1 Tax=Marinoscillum sp. TaxID=2024838 RepID=UPI003BA89DC8
MLSPNRCLNCNEPLHGRAGKKFCDDQCRATYHNQHKRPYEEAIKRLNAQLRKNRTILKTLCPLGKATVRKEVLENMGFSFRHFSSLYGKPGKTYFLCYDYGYMPIVEQSSTSGEPVQKVLIIQQQEYMKDFDPWKFEL